ncbi:hypothetical protein WA026_009600 [Henosepilachna vigintioctopunctata]|uniref:BHLH domain-containing protein n=1 Tax=Henosepilachna vigintioctopunctata TaxID=420089 RepID=A0AAW1U574_9CUCU
MRGSSHWCNSLMSNLNSCSYYSESSMVPIRNEPFYDSFNDNFDCSWNQVTVTREADATSIQHQKNHSSDEEGDTFFEALSSISFREKSTKILSGSIKHVPSRQKPPQLVEKRNLRERNRVQAVNFAFNRLRKAVPIQHARGKRISKVKTLQNAINYIKDLEELLQNNYFPPISMMGYFDAKQDSIWWDLEY